MISIKKIYVNLNTPEENGKKIGLFRILCAIFGGLVLAYLSMTFITFIIPDKVENSIILPLLFNTLIWSCTVLWISLSPTKLIAFFRFFIPSLLFAILIYILF